MRTGQMRTGDGFGAAHNRALAESAGDFVVLVDTSLELTGDLLGALVAAFEDPTVAVAGPLGLATADLCDYEERTTGEVAAVQGYCLAARPARLVAAGGVQDAFTWYRNADIDVTPPAHPAGTAAAGRGGRRRALPAARPPGLGSDTRGGARRAEPTQHGDRPRGLLRPEGPHRPLT